MLDSSLAISLIIIFIALIVWNGILTFFLVRYHRTYSEVTRGVSKKDLREILNKITDSLKITDKEIKTIQDSVASIEDQAKQHIQKVGLTRFNPFSDTGGDQSFCVCLLDEKDNGIVITSLHSRDQTRIYAKPIQKGKADGYELSREEEITIKKALQPKK